MSEIWTLGEQVGAVLKARGETVGIAESSTGGLISAALVAVPGASTFYRGAGIIYAPNAFRGLMDLVPEDITGMRSSTEPYARFMAGQIRSKLRTNWGLCETGASGPSGNGYGDAAGHVCVAAIGPDVETSSTIETGLSDRAENMHLFAEAALKLLLEQLR